MSCWSKEELENMLFSVVDELELSDEMIEKHGLLGTSPAEIVRLVLDQKDREIRNLTNGLRNVNVRNGRNLVDDKKSAVELGVYLMGVIEALRLQSENCLTVTLGGGKAYLDGKISAYESCINMLKVAFGIVQDDFVRHMERKKGS